MATTRPGNHDRGWNDPPVFLHNNSNSANSNNRVSTPPRRTLLNRRVAYPIHASKSDPVLNPCPPGLPSSGSTSSFLIPTASNSTSPSPVLFMMGAGTTSADPITQNHEVKPPGLSLDQLNEQVASDFNIEDDKEFLARVSSKILSFLEDCSHLQTRVRDDIKKKLEIFTDFWISGKICQVVKLKMALLSQALEEHNCENANALHLELMYDYVSEVGPWMVGVKRLIVEGRKLQSSESQQNSSQLENS